LRRQQPARQLEFNLRKPTRSGNAKPTRKHYEVDYMSAIVTEGRSGLDGILAIALVLIVVALMAAVLNFLFKNFGV
jgi:hypothetical protein